ncbi:hypothetical protein DM01DRAFT_1334792 [Hesseltinella vesiculosa]|uniref:Bacterial low temperature requirement A protein-domain-containing protein n=1 Tax=Hesseltinella vesiculosa TaxID=101127 RepID=A0A1X2GL32_9FUNG|nr:hypothetical protein DM01DRAFT_1334792 [Hesseltinella vesiculosa]
MAGTSTKRAGLTLRRTHRPQVPKVQVEEEDNDVILSQRVLDEEDGLVLEDVNEIRSSAFAASHISTSQSQADNEAVQPAHDKEGKPLRSHGPETFGDIVMHPIRQLELHRRRLSIFDHEQKDWDEHHPAPTLETTTLETATLETAVPASMPGQAPDSAQVATPNPRNVKSIIHFKHLMGEQALCITKDIVDQLYYPLSLREDELHWLYEMKNSDDLVEFFHRSKRDYSIKIHKTVHMGQKREQIQNKLEEKLDFIEEKLDHHSDNEEKTEKENPVEEKTSGKSTPESRRPSKEDSRCSLDIPMPENSIKLNKNVFLEIKTIEPVVHEEEPTNGPRPIFALPDPDLSDEIGEESSATWVELFGDVFYVGWLSSFTHTHHMVGSGDLAEYAGWFVVMWWTWCSSALYSARYDNGDVMHHIYKIIDLCGLVGMAGASEKYESSNGFIYGYIVMKAVLLIQYGVVLVGAILSGSFAKRPLSRYVAVNALAMILWGVSLMYAGEEHVVQRKVLWYVSIGVEVLVNMSLHRFKQVSLAASHLAERFGLFTIIILGENCLGFIRMVSESDSVINVVVANMIGVVIIFCYFFMYFDDFSKEILSSVHVSQIWMYLHFPLHLCQVAFGIALTDIITAYSFQWDQNGKDSSLLAYETCHALEAAAAGGNGTAHAAVQTTVSLAASLVKAVTESSNNNPNEVLSCEEIIKDTGSLEYAYTAFWVSAGLILCINAMIKLVNTPVAARWSKLICASRFVNAIVFFGLSAASFENFRGLGMVAIMMCCLILQSAVDLLD